MKKRAFSWKACISLFLTLCFVFIGLTGILSYGLPYTDMLAALHTLFGFLFVLAAILHIRNNWRILWGYLRKPKEKGTGYRKELLAAVLLCMFLIIGGALRIPPFGTFLDIGYQLRTTHAVEQESYQRIQTRLTQSGAEQEIILDLRKGPHFAHQEPLFLGLSLTVIPQMAIWVEDTQGNYLETLYVTQKAATGTWEGMPFMKQEIRRKAALPYWAHKRGVVSADGLYLPSQAEPLPDAVTAATPTGSFALYTRLEEDQDEVVVLMEINKSFDYNAAYSEEALGDAGKSYAEKDFSGQPALVYAATVNLRQSSSYQVMRLLGHSDPTGAIGDLFTDTSTLDTALQIVERVLVELPPLQ